MKKIFILIICTISSLFALDVTFRVDISNVDSDPSCAPTVAGSFNNWSYAHTMVDMGNDLWEQTLSLDSNSFYEFKFGICGWQLEDLSPSGDCTITTYGYTNRYLYTYSIDIVLDTYFYSNCEISNNDGGDDGDGGDGGDWTLVWSDEFNSPYINTTKWSYDVGTGSWGWGNGEAQYYTDNSNNSYIEDGKLIIKAIKESYGGADYTSARLVTKNKGDWKYGRMEVRAKMPTGVGTWPAIWLLPTDYVYGGWPNSGEIDIMEAVGYDHGVVHATCHTDVYNWFDGIPPPGGEIEVEDFDVEFHDYVLEWTENSLKWYLDGVNYYTFTNNNQGWSHWPFDQEFHLLLNIAIGGTWGGQQGIDDSIFPVQMEVEYVRVYQGGDSGGDSGGGSDDAEVTFMVDMRNEDVAETGVFVSGDSPLAGPAGILMSDSDNDNIWTLTLSIPPGTYNYKFRNGYYDFWDGPGWESSNNLDECGYGEWNDRQIIVGAEDITLEPFCFGSCLICEGNENCDLIGDLNSDSSLDILDIVILVNLILNETEGNICSDFNQDGMINILDIVSLVSEIL